jgi:hypothetical protein
MKMYYKLPERARTELIYGYPNHPMTLKVVEMEVYKNTNLGQTILHNLGYEDD